MYNYKPFSRVVKNSPGCEKTVVGRATLAQ